MMHQHVTTAYGERDQQQQQQQQSPNSHQSMLRHLRRLTHFLFLLFLFSLTSCDHGVSAQRREGRTYPLLSAIPKTSFNCLGQAAGYYADPETDCQVYHMCDTLHKQYSYLCPNYTLFNQKFMVCDHWYMVNCSSAPTYYELNDHIGEVPSSRENDNNNANAIGTTAGKTPINNNQDATVKEAKFTPATFTFKTSGTPASRIPTNSLVTKNSILETTTNLPETTTLPVDPFTSLKPSPTPRSGFQFQLSTPSALKNFTTTRQPLPTPSRFFQLPRVENPFSSRPGSLPKPALPSSFLQPPGQPVSSHSSGFSGRESEVTANNSTLSNHDHFHHGIPFVQTPRPGTPFTMVPGVVARDPGNKFSFTSSRQKKPSLESIAFNDVVFQPLAIRPKDKGRKIFTSAPASITLDPHHHDGGSSSDQDTQHSTTSVFATPVTNNKAPGTIVTPASAPVGIRVPSIVLQPPPSVSLNIPPFLPRLQQTLIPPVRMKQEFLTPLVMPVRFGNSGLLQASQPSAIIAPSTFRFKFPASRSSRDFFIPTAGLSLPDEGPRPSLKNSLSDLQNSLSDSVQEKKSNMTMVFPALKDAAKITALQINPDCPKCHPAFLRPGQCKPCVLIR